eukprot:SAG11_NODE_36985_length_259_cov_0.612500_1_plen_39_part_10
MAVFDLFVSRHFGSLFARKLHSCLFLDPFADGAGTRYVS